MAEKIVVDIEFKTNVQKISKDLESVKDTLTETNESLEDIAKTQKSSDGALKKLSKGFKGVGLAMKTLGIGIIVEAFGFLKEIMMQNQTVVDGVAIATETLGVIFNQVTSVVTDVFDAVSKSSEGFEGLQKVIGGLMTIAISPLKLAFFGITLGLQEAQLTWEQSFFGDGDPETIAQLNQKITETKQNLTEVVDEVVVAGEQVATNFAEAVTEVGNIVTIATEVATEGIKNISIESALATGTALADAKKNEELLEIERASQQLQSQLFAENQRQIRDDTRKTLEERINANNELGRILEEQTAKEKEVVDEKVRIAQLELSTNETSVELKKKLAEAELGQLELQERIAGQKSEQLTNEASLEKELLDVKNEVALATMGEREQELLALKQDYDAKLELARISGEETVLITDQYNDLVHQSNEKFAEEDLKTAEELAKAKADAQKQEIKMLSDTIQMAGDLFAEGSVASKVAGVSTATINTWTGVTEALKLPPPFSYIQAGITLASGLASVKNIMAVKTEKPANVQAPSGGSLPSGGGEGGTSSDMESLIDLSGLPSITEQFNTAFTQDAPIQAYVVEQQVTDSQQINTMIQQKATL
tara:strand:- start:1006 stop:2787 length:1782 start_codon:yes stop_codon:yes gene_type:complete